ncbi:hypothetical protein GCM10025770_38130 [Viridibacterium curvum]|uniref:Uncharacterized protein n=1 Tax=Viridibacterium curvum TaxID=1101404 RepID=A0ABP9R762_9RHOO
MLALDVRRDDCGVGCVWWGGRRRGAGYWWRRREFCVLHCRHFCVQHEFGCVKRSVELQYQCVIDVQLGEQRFRCFFVHRDLCIIVLCNILGVLRIQFDAELLRKLHIPGGRLAQRRLVLEQPDSCQRGRFEIRPDRFCELAGR